MKINIQFSLPKRHIEAILRSEGFTNGHGVKKSIALIVAEVTVLDALQEAHNAAIEQKGTP